MTGFYSTPLPGSTAGGGNRPSRPHMGENRAAPQRASGSTGSC
ncbi:hypothetical protein C882_1200 [Caenispirillum salinarum AK4]|uniref:Uncharacterized protein n=1 Tax=Caenispirillum salinarum AK4 TaxID=1238182 RepID=K9GTZ0_9PROT|nr:hypothetical protein C882_1200 [Caenispirillum salinarum AK4]